MRIGFIGFGEVNKRLAELLKDEDLLTSYEGRSDKTIENIKDAKIKVVSSFKEVAINSDILFSATSPKQALIVAKTYGKYCNGIFIDLNNISPDTADEISRFADNFVDAAIIGGINNSFTLYLSGQNLDKLNFLSNYFPVKAISNNMGDASRLKLMRSIYTKSIAAIFMELFAVSDDFDLTEELLDTISLSEGREFKALAQSRVINTRNNSKRKKEEILEILQYFKDYDLKMVEATLDVLSDL